MPKKRERNGEEYLRGKLREAQKTIRQLEKRVKELTKHEHFPAQDEEPMRDTEDTYRQLPIYCNSCGKGQLEMIDIVGRVFSVCKLCGDRKKVAGP
jgi:formate-dependent nitrite reductase cytochrome c552 subunit